MKKLILTMAITIVLFTVFPSYANSEMNSICKIQIQSQSPLILEHEKIDYTTTRLNEIVYIEHYFKSLEYIEEQVHPSSDGSSILIIKECTDGSKIYFSVYPDNRHISKKSAQIISIPMQEYDRFCDAINALKNNRILLPEKVTFAPSPWAKESIEKAVEIGLVPSVNQINYTGAITRLEVCHLTYNLLKNSGYRNCGTQGNPFLDTNDKDVETLYQLGIIDGKSKTEFAPYDFITRAEYAKILNNVYYQIGHELSSSQNTIEYKDEESIPKWSIEAVKTMSMLGILKGNERGEFEPQRNATKEEVIITFLRMCQS